MMNSRFPQSCRAVLRRGHSRFIHLIKQGLIVCLIGLLLGLALRAYDTQKGPPLDPWHTYVPKELSVKELDAADWATYLKAEDEVFESVKTHVTQKLSADEQVGANRYFDQSPVYAERFSQSGAQNWNRSFVMMPVGEPVGVVVLLHGLTDSPYSLRHIGELYRMRGFVALAIRMPAHGTVPAALAKVEYEDWMAATRLAVREARKLVGAPRPLHLVGFSNGGALAMKYVLDTLDDKQLARPDRVVLISPMIGVREYARFAGVAGWPAVFPAFAKAAWLSVLPEYNPFKYNSFPVNGARQSYRLTRDVQAEMIRQEQAGRLGELPPILTFQSVMDGTVSTAAVVDALYAHLPEKGGDKGHELVLFDLNRSAQLGPLLKPSAAVVLSQWVPPMTRHYRLTVITNASPQEREVVERSVAAGSESEQVRRLGLSFPEQIYSLSHVALPFPMNDALYGLEPDLSEDFGVRIGAFAMRGESQVLVVGLDTLLRLSCNPFYPYLEERIGQGISGG